MIPGMLRLSLLGLAVLLSSCATSSGPPGSKPDVEKVTINWEQKPVKIYHRVYHHEIGMLTSD